MNKKAKTTKEPTLAQLAAAKQEAKDQQTAAAMKATTAGQIWNEINGLSIEMFALPNQFVNMHCHPVFIDDTKLHLIANSSAVLPSLEVAIGNRYTVELVDKYLVVARAAK